MKFLFLNIQLEIQYSVPYNINGTTISYSVPLSILGYDDGEMDLLTASGYG